jgi:predicted amidohydrolase YtcJ
VNALLISNGRVIDGTGAAPREESVLIEGERIAAVGVAAEKQAGGRRDLTRIDASAAHDHAGPDRRPLPHQLRRAEFER